MDKLIISLDKTTKTDIANLHIALNKIKSVVSPKEINTRTIGDSTVAALIDIQKRNGLTANGKLNDKTLNALNAELFDVHHTRNKTRVGKLQVLLQKVHLPVAKEEMTSNRVGDSTRKAIEAFQKKTGLTADGILNETVLNKLQEEAIKETYSTKTQIGKLHNTLQRVAKIAKLDVAISPEEVKMKNLGISSANVIKSLQKKYGLSPTGKLDQATLDKVNNIAASRGVHVTLLKKPVNTQLKTITKLLSLNRVSAKVGDMQKALSYLGYKIDVREFNTQTFGKKTREAILAFQKNKGIPLTGQLEPATLKLINKEIVKANPDAATSQLRYRIRGSVRDVLWQGKSGMVVKLFEKLIDGEGKEALASQKNHLNGFFDIPYNPPIDQKTGLVKEKFHLVIKLYESVDSNPSNDKLVCSQLHYNINRVHWVNFTQEKTADGKTDYNIGNYQGDSEFHITRNILVKVLRDVKIEDLKETAENKQITHLNIETGLSTDDIIRQVLSHRVAKIINKPDPLTPEVFYAFICQNLPPNLPGDLLRGAGSEWETIDQLTERASSGIVFLSKTLQQQAIDDAISQNLVSQAINNKRDAILQELENQQNTFTLEKPILVGNQNLKALLAQSKINVQHYATVADTFISNKGINPDFWKDLQTKAATLGAEAVTDFTATVEVGNMSINHIPTVHFLKSKIGIDPRFKTAGSFAKLDQAGLVALINENGKIVPDNIPGNTADEKVATYAAAMKKRAELLFPAVSLVAEIKRSNTEKLTKIREIETFIDTQPDFNLKQHNIDKYFLEKGINLDPKIKEELKVVQRVHKLASDPVAGAALVDEGLHSSMQIYFAGKSRLTNLLTAKAISQQQVSRMYELSKMQYFQIIARLIDFRRETNSGTPAAIIPQMYSKQEIQDAIGDIPNLESLFGSLDYCDCEHCKSLYGPAAYLTDMLRFIKEHSAIDSKKTVKDILFERRPDLGNIKLNCENTNTPLPYIDLVCEILENNIEPQQKDFSYQTIVDTEKAETTAKKLRAIPQNVRVQAYNVLCTADYPMSSSFNLFQEEARVYLNYLRVPRFELMEVFQNISDPANKVPDDIAVTAEYFGISSYEKELITTQKQNTADQNKYWGFDTTQAKVFAKNFMDRSKLGYYELLELLLVRFINDPALPNRSEIERLPDTCNTDVQQINNLTVVKFDLMHRFIRLWRKTGWKMWELDLLIRNPKIGNNTIDGNTLVNLKRFKQLQERLKLPLEILLAFYGDINREVRIKPEKPEVKINPLYKNLFQNISITRPLDTYFTAIDSNDNPITLDYDITYGINIVAPYNGYTPVPTVISALALCQTDFDLLIGKTDNHLSVTSLSILLRYAYLARGLKLSVKDLLLLLSVTNSSDPFITIQATIDCAKYLDIIKTSGISLIELDYILNYSPDSSAGLTNESLVQLIEALRNILEITKLKIGELNTIASFDADALQPMTDDQLITSFTPLQNAIISLKDNIVDENFTVDEANYVLSFNKPQLNPANKTKLITTIKKLQQNVKNILDVLETQKLNQIKSQVASAFNLTNEQSDIILTNLTMSPALKTLLEILDDESLFDESLLDKNLDGSYKDKAKTFFNTYLLLHKVALIISRLKISKEDLEWFIKNQSNVRTLNLSALPVTAPMVPNDFAGWLNLYKFLDFKSKFPEPENASIHSILTLAKNTASTKPQIFDEIVKLTQWSKEDILSIDAGFKLQHKDADPVAHTPKQLDYTNAEVYYRLKKCFDQMKLTGVNAQTMLSWALISSDMVHDTTVAQQTQQAVKSKYEQDNWLEKITPLHDDIREKKRKALVEYQLENSKRNQQDKIIFDGKEIPNPIFWKDSNALFKYFLIDVEMSACQLTSRIKQAISSVQLFIQRCFLNLENRYVEVAEDEKEDVASANAWSQWKWMKNYRIWEANRKIFFYPENWIEPELRDDKSPFFEDLENEILQNEITKENVETAFLNYLHKVDEVSHLEVCGMYHEIENLSGDETMYEINIVHVIGRTKAIPHIYYYRSYDMNYCTWSAWEKIEVDITGEHVVPVVYNRKLHLFWLQFIEKPMKTKKIPAAQPTDGPTEAPEPMKVMEIQLGWTIKKSGGWAPKKVSKQKLIHPWERPHYSYNLKPYYLDKFNELYLDIYLSTSREFNNNKFYDPYQKLSDNPVYLTGNRFNETYLPWHSSSFVFDGEVKDIKLKGLGGHFVLDIPSMIHIDEWLSNDSYTYVHENFGSEGEHIKELDPKYEYGPRLRLPNGMHFNYTHLTNNQVHSANANQLRVLENNSTTTLLGNAISPFELIITQQDLQLNTCTTDHPLFYQDNQRAFFIKPEWETILNNYGQVISHNRKYRFLPFYHPYTMLFIREFNRNGIDGLLNRKIQTTPQIYKPKNTFSFAFYNQSSSAIVDTIGTKDVADYYKNPVLDYSYDVVDYSFGGAYSIYNWELFFHAPLMIACRLMQNQKFEDAMSWFHYIFDPTNVEKLPTPQRYWVTKPFFQYNSDTYRKQRIENILSNINLPEYQSQLIAWKNNPFKPHLIARYRPVAYQKNVVMKYLDNLIAWGDMLFKRDTIESINEASLLYMLAYEILGERPQKVPNVKHKELTFNELESKLDEIGNARVDAVIEDTLLPITIVPSTSGAEPIPQIEIFYFCIPNNDYLTKYWDTVEDRLFKLRHCMNIEGVVRQLPLFEPPIDPALLVKAAAAGIDLSSVLNDISAPVPHYRFRIVIQKAVEICNEVKALGEKLLSTLEKKDSEELSLLRSQHEIQLLEAVKEVRKKQIDEAVETIGSLNKAQELVEQKINYYENIPRMNDLEIAGAVLHGGAIISEIVATILNTVGGVTELIPATFTFGAAGFGGSPVFTTTYGASNIAKSSTNFAALFQGLSTILHSTGSLLETQGSYSRRDDENKHQAKLATIEIDQIQFQINAAEIRQAIAEKELENQELQIENSKTVDDYMRNKYTNAQLYSWMITKISTVYFQAYQLAFDMAKKAEKCFQYELGIENSNYIQFGYWDSLKKGLLSGDELSNGLKRLEAAYIDQNKREFEITKHISLVQMFPLSLITLKETGKCIVSIPEWIFDMDYPGHYMRRIKNVSVSIPCVIGPYTGVNCTLSLLKNETRIDSNLSGGGYAKVDENDTRFRTMFGSISSIATSSAQNDSGMFELNFNDDRYLPFEGAGVISDWQIEMPKENNYFDYSSLSDVILHISYTARSGGGQLAIEAKKNLQLVLPNSTARLFSIRHEFSAEWYKLLNPDNGGEQILIVIFKPEHFPFFIRGKLDTIKIKKLDMFIESTEAGDYDANMKINNNDIKIGGKPDLVLSPDANFQNVHHLAVDLAAGSQNRLWKLELKIKLSGAANFKSLPTDKIDNLFILFQMSN